MSSSAGAVFFTMASHYNTEEALRMVMDPESEDSSLSSAEDSGDDAEISTGEETEESSSDSRGADSSEIESGDMEEAPAGWIGKNGLTWNPTNAETLRYVPAAIGNTGPTHYATARICDPLSSFLLFVTDEIMLHIVSKTNLQGRYDRELERRGQRRAPGLCGATDPGRSLPVQARVHAQSVE